MDRSLVEKARSAGVVAWPGGGVPLPAEKARYATLSAAGDAAESDDEVAEQECANATERGAALLEDFLLRFDDSDSDDSDVGDDPQGSRAKPHTSRITNTNKNMTLAECISALAEREQTRSSRATAQNRGVGSVMAKHG